MHLFTAPARGTGKTLLMEVGAAIFTGLAPLTSVPPTNDEMGKVLLGVLASGASHLLLDDVRNLDFEKLLAAITAGIYQDRWLGGHVMVTFTIRMVWAASYNNIQIGEELARRSVEIRIDAGMEYPEERSSFSHPDLTRWVRSHRSELIGAVLTLVQAWIAESRPAYSGKSPPMGRFEAWTEVIGGILETVGVAGFLENRQDFRQRADSESVAWRSFVIAWFEAYGDKPVPCALLLSAAFERFAERLGSGDERIQKSRLGKLLKTQEGRVYAGKRIICAGAATSGEHKGASLYRLEPVAKTGEDGEHGERVSPQV
jgi:hypothetical protein